MASLENSVLSRHIDKSVKCEICSKGSINIILIDQNDEHSLFACKLCTDMIINNKYNYEYIKKREIGKIYIKNKIYIH